MGHFYSPRWFQGVSRFRSIRFEPLERREMLSATLFVDGDAAIEGDGQSWATAHCDLQTALEIAADLNADANPSNDVDAIWIAEGSYVPSAELEAGDARSSAFSLVDGVLLHGGFAGSETSLDQRDWAAHQTVLSGDLGTAGDSADNAYTVVYCGDRIEAAIDGITITNGRADGSYVSGHPERQNGGGVYCGWSTLTLTNCEVLGNTAQNGGGICSHHGTLTIENCALSGNSAENGGAIWNSLDADYTNQSQTGADLTEQTSTDSPYGPKEQDSAGTGGLESEGGSGNLGPDGGEDNIASKSAEPDPGIDAANLGDASLPDLPHAYVNTDYDIPPDDGNTTYYRVTEGQDLQAVFDTALSGSVILLESGATFTGHYVIDRSDLYVIGANVDALPEAGTRATPADADGMAKIVTPDFNPAIVIKPGSKNIRFIGIEVASDYTTREYYQYGIIRIGWQSPPSDDPYANPADNVIFDRCYIHGNATGNVRDGIQMHYATNVAIVGCTISDIHSTNESHGIHVVRSSNVLIHNNTVIAAGINVFVHSESTQGEVPEDIVVSNNTLYKPLSWNPNDPSYAGIPWLVKNLFEIKNAHRVLVEDNLMENTWPSGQDGTAVLLTPREAEIEDVTFRRNVVTGFVHGMMINNCEAHLTRVLVEDNLFFSPGPPPGCSQDAFRIAAAFVDGVLGDLSDIVIRHNTIETRSGGATYSKGVWYYGAYENEISRLEVTDNLIIANWGMAGNSRREGFSSTDFYCEDYLFQRNVLAGPNGRWYPETENFKEFIFPEDLNAVGLSDTTLDSVDDFLLLPTSPYCQAATDGTAIGADIKAILSWFDPSMLSTSFTITNSTIAGNSAERSGGGVYVFGDFTTVKLDNTIVARNTAQFAPDVCDFSSNSTGSHNLIGDGSGQTDLVNGQDGNIIGTAESPIDPCFIRNPSDGGDGWGDRIDTGDHDESANDDYGDSRLRVESPAIEAGDSTLLPLDLLDLDADGNIVEAVPFDLDGSNRLKDGDADGIAVVDIGAFEYLAGNPPIEGDLNRDGQVNSMDILLVRQHWDRHVSPGDLAMGDANEDGLVSSQDLDIVRTNWNRTAPAVVEEDPSSGSELPDSDRLGSPTVYGPAEADSQEAAVDAVFSDIQRLADAAWCETIEGLRIRQKLRLW